ncbi:MAG TPA: DinB family protein [Thermoanaerobaculaceae bacterium]|nr:DinB family protein [Thermoanaerobaculaceae bacterium]
MTNREFYLERLKSDGPGFVKAVRAIPATAAGYRPHPKSRSAAELAGLFVASTNCALDLVENRSAEWAHESAATDPAATADELEKAQKRLAARVAELDGRAWSRKAQLRMGGQVAWSAPLGQMLWGFYFDAIHHRGQLSAYIRPAGGKVPSIYGPSGDDPGA